jgi:hypothetical protein
MGERCKECGRPFATTAHEQSYPAWCNGAASYGCLRAKLAKLEAVVEAQEAALSVARRIVNECGFADHAFGGLLVEFEQADAELEKAAC